MVKNSDSQPEKYETFQPAKFGLSVVEANRWRSLLPRISILYLLLFYALQRCAFSRFMEIVQICVLNRLISRIGLFKLDEANGGGFWTSDGWTGANSLSEVSSLLNFVIVFSDFCFDFAFCEVCLISKVQILVIVVIVGGFSFSPTDFIQFDFLLESVSC